ARSGPPHFRSCRWPRPAAARCLRPAALAPSRPAPLSGPDGPVAGRGPGNGSRAVWNQSSWCCLHSDRAGHDHKRLKNRFSMKDGPLERYGLNSLLFNSFMVGSTLPVLSENTRPHVARAETRAARTLWREIVDLLHRDENREQFSNLLERARALSPSAADREDLIHCIELALTVKERFEFHQQRERGLLAVLESAQDLTAITDPDRILQAIVQRARRLMNCDVG